MFAKNLGRCGWICLMLAVVLGASRDAEARVLDGPAPRAEASASTVAPVPPVNPAPATQADSKGAVPSTAGKIEERWYMLRFQGKRAGHMWVREEETPEAFREWSKMEMSIKRGEAEVKVMVESTTVENPDGSVVSMSTTMNLGAEPTVTTYVFKADKVEVTTKASGNTTTTEVDRPAGEWVGPMAAGRLVAKRLAAGDTEIKVRTIDASMGLRAVEYTRVIQERETKLDVLGKVVPAVKWSSTVDVMPGMETTEYVDLDGHPLQTEIDFGVIKMELIACDRRMALAKVDAPELMASTLVKIEQPIARARELKNAAYELTIKEGKFPVLPSTGVQLAKLKTVNKAYVRVTMGSPAPAPEGDINRAEYIQANTLVNKDDERIRQLAAESVMGLTGVVNKADVAERMRQFVYDYIKDKSLDVGFASASQVARTGEGDCSEHAVLLCAMLRSAGIPSRVASGLVYVDEFGGEKNVFGYHMWTQALLDMNGMRRWVDLDATLTKVYAFDATHICLDVSSLADAESLNSMVTLTPIIGQLTITVQRAE